jgi:hypothetical protein
MAKSNQYIKTKANYTLVKKHMTTYSGDIFEQDHLTISAPYDGVYDDSVTMFSDSNFKFRIRGKENAKKKHFNGNWLESDNGSTYWTEADCNQVNTSETSIKLKPNYTSLKDFAYFGSASQLVKATITDIIMHYPGGIYYLGDSYPIDVNGDTYYLVANDFDIDIMSMGCVFDEEENPMRVLSASLDKYNFKTTDKKLTELTFEYINGLCNGEILGKSTIVSDGGAVVLYVYLDKNGEKKILTDDPGAFGNPIIVPTKEVFDEMYDSLDDFSKVLLDYTTNPLFVAKFDTPHFNRDGRYWVLEKYIFPSITSSDGKFFSPRTSGPAFSGYFAKLMALAESLDEFDSNNLIRMLTHESILNLDWSVLNTKYADDEDNSVDNSRIKAMLEIYARQFDDIKRYADNVKNTTKISYNESSNVPDYFLSDKANNDGWDLPNMAPIEDTSIYTNVLYPQSMSVGYNSSDYNIEFERRLILNSRFIKSLRGTRYGVETLLGLLGLKNGAKETDQSINTGLTAGYYELHEHIAVATTFPSLIDINLAIENSDDYDETYSQYFDYPIAIVNRGETPSANFVVPWYDRKNSYTNYMYFQMNGGWGHVPSKKINLEISTASSITETAITSIYDETIQYLKYATTIDELTGYTQSNIRRNMVCYVENIEGIYGGYNADEEDKAIIEETSGECFSHYFILKNTALSPFIGFVTPDESGGKYNCYGWRNVFRHEFDGTSAITCDGTCVLYLESIQSDNSGNNMHAGFGEYDDGLEYLEYFNQIFKNKLENNQFSLVSSNDGADLPISIDTIKNIGFNVDFNLVVDDTKCHCFINTDSTGIEIIDPSVLGDDANDSEQTDSETLVIVGDEVDDDMDLTNWDDIYDSFVNPIDGGDSVDEMAALSVINVKNTNINFITNNNIHYREYIQYIIIPLLEQMIPSTTIFSYTFDGEESPAIAEPFSNAQPISITTLYADAAVPSEYEPLTEFDINTNTIPTIIEVE